MANRKCLFCYESLTEEPQEYHKRCCKKLYSTETVPEVDFRLDEIEKIAENLVRARLAITGVQPKVSVELKKPARGQTTKPVLSRVTFTDLPGLWGRYILKPPHKDYPFMPEIEDLSMHLAEICKIKTAIHSLVRLKSGELAYLTKRFDRIDDQKLPLEDTCQLTGLLTEDKYHSSMEKAGKAIAEYSSNSGMDMISFLEIGAFSFLIGNADMHLKNFSLLTDNNESVGLAPAYDLLATKLLTRKDNEEMALPINGKKSQLKQHDFVQLGLTLDIPQKAIENVLSKLKRKLPEMLVTIDKGFLPNTLKVEFKKLIETRAQILFL